LPVVAVRDGVCLLGRFPALAGVDLVVEAGEIVWLAGPNGAGKTTLLRVIAGLERLHSGEASVLGHDLARDRAGHRRRLALVSHATNCYDELTVAENLRFAARATGRSPADAREAAERFGLGPVAGVLHSALSEGQRRRLSLAVAWCRRPELLLLDEPHAGLDADARSVLDTTLAGLAAGGRTVVFASHETERAGKVAARAVRMAGGRVVPDPPPLDARPPALEHEPA
jgi:heme ABC exporter ATP-binding subunit CcmA